MAELWTNNAESTLSGSITDSATSLTVQAGHGALFPSPSNGDYFWLTIESEIVKCTARSTDTLTVTRAQQGTSAAAHADAVAVKLNWTAESARFASYNWVPGRVTGLWYTGTPMVFGSNGTIVLNRLFAIPFYVGAAQAFDGIGVASIGVASAFTRLGVYADNSGKPSTLIVDAGQVDCGTSGEKSASISVTLRGLVWVAGVGQGVAPSVTRMGLLQGPHAGSSNLYSVATAGMGYSQDGISGTLPSSWGSTYNVVAAANVAPQIGLRAA